jgi:hypothetical protein
MSDRVCLLDAGELKATMLADVSLYAEKLIV